MRMLSIASIAVAVAAASSAAPLPAQTWRTLDVSRQMRDTEETRVHVQYGPGRLDVRPSTDPVLYAMQLRYDEDRATPVHRFDAVDHSVTLGVRTESMHFRRHDDGGSEMRLSLSRVAPFDLQIDVGASKATLDLGGLVLRRLKLNAGASEARIEFSAPNPTRMRELEIDAGAASFQARNLANASAGEMRVQGGVGNVDLDFGGQWSQDLSLVANMAFGKLTIHVPRDVGVRLEVERFLASVDRAGLERRGDAYVSDNWDSARYRLRIRAHTAFGGFELDRGDR